MPRPADLFHLRNRRFLCVLCSSLFLFVGCSHHQKFNPNSITFLIESNPVNLDPRFATDSQSQRIDGLLFSSLVYHDDDMNLHGDLAQSWDAPDPLIYIFHLRRDVHFHDGRPLTSADIKSTFDFMLDPANHSPKRGAFQNVAKIETPDPATIVFHLKEPYASFLWDLTRPAVGIVPQNAAPDFSLHPIGSGPFRFVSQAQDDQVVIRKNSGYFVSPPSIETVRFRIVPDAVVRALELRKGSADLEMSSLPADMIPALSRQPDLTVTEHRGTNFAYLGINFQDPILAHREVRQALAYATDRASLISYLLHGEAVVASGILPPNHWAYEPNVTQYGYDPAHASALLDQAGLPRGKDGIRFQLTLKTSTEEQARLVGAVLQQEWRKVGIALELRPLELATLLSDSARGNFQLTYLRWVGANNDPAVFELVFSSKRFPPNGANRGHYRNPQVDALTDQIRVETDRNKRKELCSEVQKILADDLPYIPMWFTDVVSVHRRELGDLTLSPAADYDFLTTLKPAS